MSGGGSGRNGSAPLLALPVILTGGRSRRFGSPKGWAEVGGVPIIRRVRAALREATGAEPVLVGDPEGEYESLGLDRRPDIHTGRGPAGGIHTALVRAEEAGASLAVVAGCDMPFLDARLLRTLTERGNAESVLVPESGGPLGVEPLCAVYGVGCLAALEALLADRGSVPSMERLLEVLPTRHLPEGDVREFGEPERLFLNVNTPAERERAEAWAEAAGGVTPGEAP